MNYRLRCKVLSLVNMKILTETFSFQDETIKRMQHFEMKYDGGMLFNQAGLGKSICALSLIASQQNQQQEQQQRHIVTLILCPAGLVDNWHEEIKKHTDLPDSSIVKYSGSKRRDLKIDENTQIVISSYSIISREYISDANNTKFQEDSLFGKTKFDRIILDEAHYIRNHKSTLSSAVLYLSSIQSTCVKRWVITATPIFNTINDMYVYFNFLSLEGMDSRSEWTNRISKNITGIKMLNTWVEKYSIKFLKRDVLKDLPPKIENTVMLEFDDLEREFYESLYDYSLTRMSMLLNRIKYLNNEIIKTSNREGIKKVLHGNVMTYILRLKQACNSPWLILKKMERFKNVKHLGEAVTMLNYFKDSLYNPNSEECSVCYDAFANTIAVPCGHKCCKGCWDKLFNMGIYSCPTCRNYVSDVKEIKDDLDVDKLNDMLSNLSINDDSYLKLKVSSKIRELIRITNEKIAKSEKIVIVSQWTSFLDIIMEVFNQDAQLKNVKSISLRGEISLKDRTKMINMFQNDNNNKDVKICFLSLGSSAEGINLTSANNLVLADAWWNEAKTSQACDRIHRITQTKQVNIYKFQIHDSIEKNIQKKLQQKSGIAELILKSWNEEVECSDDSWIVEEIKLLEK